MNPASVPKQPRLLPTIDKKTFVSLVLFGIFAFVAGFLEYRIMYVNSGWARTDGYIDSTYRDPLLKVSSNRMVIVYTVDGKAYKLSTLNNSSRIPVTGEKRKVAYNPTNPSHAKMIIGFRPLAIVYPFIGLAIIVFGWWLYKKPKINPVNR